MDVDARSVMSVRRRAARALVILALAGAPARPVAAQSDAEPMNLRWWHPLAAGAGVASLVLLDEPVRDALQRNRSDFLDDVGTFAERFKDPEVFVMAVGGTFALALATQSPKVIVTGAHIVASYALSSSVMIGSKWLFGRSRPSRVPYDSTDFDWFDGGSSASFPSGSAAVVFSLATTLADAIERRPVTIALYGLATLNAWGRMNSNRHWLSDVAAGAIYGITAAKLVNGRWTVFGLRPPTVWTDGRTTGLSFSVGP